MPSTSRGAGNPAPAPADAVESVDERPAGTRGPFALAYRLSGGPFGPLGQFGPLGPYGPLGPHGPVRRVRPALTTVYERWKRTWEGEHGLLTEDGPLGSRGPFGPLGPLGPAGPLGPFGLGPFADQPVGLIEEAEYQEALSETSYVVGTVGAGEDDDVWVDGEGFEDVYEIRLLTSETVTIVLTQSRPNPWYDVVLLDDEESVVDRSTDAPGGIKFLQTTLPAGGYRVGISLADGRTLRSSADREYALSVVIY